MTSLKLCSSFYGATGVTLLKSRFGFLWSDWGDLARILFYFLWSHWGDLTTTFSLVDIMLASMFDIDCRCFVESEL